MPIAYMSSSGPSPSQIYQRLCMDDHRPQNRRSKRVMVSSAVKQYLNKKQTFHSLSPFSSAQFAVVDSLLVLAKAAQNVFTAAKLYEFK